MGNCSLLFSLRFSPRFWECPHLHTLAGAVLYDHRGPLEESHALSLCSFLLSRSWSCRVCLPQFSDSYHQPFNSGHPQALLVFPVPSYVLYTLSLGIEMKASYGLPPLFSLSQASLSFFIWCLISWKLWFHSSSISSKTFRQKVKSGSSYSILAESGCLHY